MQRKAFLGTLKLFTFVPLALGVTLVVIALPKVVHALGRPNLRHCG
jgi:hypothetical protein